MGARGAAWFATVLHQCGLHSEGHRKTKFWPKQNTIENWKATMSTMQRSTDLMGAAAMVEAAEDVPLVVPNLSCRRRTSRGGLATEFTNAILTCRPAHTEGHS